MFIGKYSKDNYIYSIQYRVTRKHYQYRRYTRQNENHRVSEEYLRKIQSLRNTNFVGSSDDWNLYEWHWRRSSSSSDWSSNGRSSKRIWRRESDFFVAASLNLSTFGPRGGSGRWCWFTSSSFRGHPLHFHGLAPYLCTARAHTKVVCRNVSRVGNYLLFTGK